MSLVSHRLFMPKLLMSENREVSDAACYAHLDLLFRRAGPLSTNCCCHSSNFSPPSLNRPGFEVPPETYIAAVSDSCSYFFMTFQSF